MPYCTPCLAGSSNPVHACLCTAPLPHTARGKRPVLASGAVAVAGAATAPLTLECVRTALLRQEDTIIFSLIERAQLGRNEATYIPGEIAVPAYTPDGRPLSFLEYLLRDTEAVHGRVRRYLSPDEHAFFPEALPPMVLPPVARTAVLAPCAARINVNAQIMERYLTTIVPAVTQPVDDGSYGSSATQDVLALQALSKRIHYGKFVAEAKFRGNPEEYAAMIRARDREGLMAALTFPEQERRVVDRVRRKAETFGQELDESGVPVATSYKVAPELVAALYRDWVMPMTKDVQVMYLLGRLDEE